MSSKRDPSLAPLWRGEVTKITAVAAEQLRGEQTSPAHGTGNHPPRFRTRGILAAALSLAALTGALWLSTPFWSRDSGLAQSTPAAVGARLVATQLVQNAAAIPDQAQPSGLHAAEEPAARSPVEANPVAVAATSNEATRPADESDEPIECPRHLSEVFTAVRRAAERENLHVSASLLMPMRLWRVLAEEYRSYEDKVAPLNKEMEPITLALVQWKQDHKLIEDLPHPQLASSPKEKRERMAALASARKPTQPDQHVSVGGSGDTMWVIRVDMSEDRDLMRLSAAISRERRALLERLSIACFPFFQMEKKP